MLKAVFFDLDGTLLPMDENDFVKAYFSSLCENVKHLGYDSNKLINLLKTSIKYFYQNDGTKTNDELFWDLFKVEFNDPHLEHKSDFDGYYEHDFKKVSAVCKENPYAREIIDYVNKNVEYCMLTTNPIIPSVACYQRMGFVGLKKEDFDYITLFEDFKYAKPNPMYFQTVLDKFNLKAEEVILFGNNDVEDFLCAKKVGIKTYLIKGHEIIHEDLKLDYELITMDQVIPTIEKEIALRK